VGDKGDRRVTGETSPDSSYRRGMVSPSVLSVLPIQGESEGVIRVGAVITTARSMIIRAGGCQRLGTSRHALEFSREFDRQKPVEKCEDTFFYGITACHPSVTLVTHEKGCKPFVAGGFVTLSPFITKNPILQNTGL